MRHWLFVIIGLLLFVGSAYASQEVCMDVDTAKRIVVELKEKRLLEEELKEMERLVENLRKQNQLLSKQNKLLREQVELVRNQAELYRVAYEEEKKKHKLGLFEKGKWIGLGIVVGILLGMF